MHSNSFEITGASVYAHAGQADGRVVEFASRFEASVSAFGGVTPDHVTIMVGVPRALAAGKLALWIDLDRATCLRVSDEMLKIIASGKRGNVSDRAFAAEAWDEAGGVPCLSEKDATFKVSNDSQGGKADGAWHLKVDRYSAKMTREAGAEVSFDAANARMLAELLRAMPFR
jgi:hypothetical protein